MHQLQAATLLERYVGDASMSNCAIVQVCTFPILHASAQAEQSVSNELHTLHAKTAQV